MSKYIEVTVVRELFSAVYIKVPDSFIPSDALKPDFRKTLDAAVEGLHSGDWDKEEDYTPESVHVVAEKTALMYDVFDAEKEQA